METLVVLWRFILTFLLSFAFGLERQTSHKPIGFGTFTFVAAGSCGLAILSTLVPSDNPFTLLGAIITGIGFLGAGAMVKAGDRITGATTAAGIWIMAIFGMFMGLGYYTLALLAYTFVWTVVFYDRFLESRGIGNYRSRIVLTSSRLLNEKEVEDAIGARIYRLDEIGLDSKGKCFVQSYFVEGRKSTLRRIPEKIKGKEWLVSAKLEVYGR
ncbi:MAG: MgtC/SapB family protein [Candidatus Aenigmarchaeota archaeon]|nr:MgtC/SapB family protein [Candidatus Aenigmarchaeota archaeon]